MKKIKVGITGQAGFVGTHLFNELGLCPEKFERIPFEDRYFSDFSSMKNFVQNCDAIVHLAAVNRHTDENELYNININLVNTLIEALTQKAMNPHILFSSSIQEDLDNLYGKSKFQGRQLLTAWARKNNASFTGFIIPNVYGPFGLPNYNSFVATFCHKLTHNENPQIINDNDVSLIYVSSLCRDIISDIINNSSSDKPIIKEYRVQAEFENKVSSVFNLLQLFKMQYFDQGIIPVLHNRDEVNLFNTFRSYIELDKYFPYFLKKNTDARGDFIETLKSGVGGQVSFSTTKPGITRGNHYHTRKIERFIIIKGRARIQLRKIGEDKVFEYELDGNNASYIDMPVWYTHNITNIGEEYLYTQFWINEWYDPSDPDTFFEKV
jgi:UDP-2-acetamido-2,6-beta-L-arabino-hexul-4-ose reductase